MIKVIGCVVIEDGCILLLHKIKRGWCETPGGKVEEGEMPEQTVVREAKEEIGCGVEVIFKLGEEVFGVDDRRLQAVWYKCRLLGDPFVAEPDDFDALRWVRICELSSLNLSPAVEKLFKFL